MHISHMAFEWHAMVLNQRWVGDRDEYVPIWKLLYSVGDAGSDATDIKSTGIHEFWPGITYFLCPNFIPIWDKRV